MPIYFYWGEDEFAIAQAVKKLHDRTLDPAWASFNYDKILPDQTDPVIQGLNQAMTPPFGNGSRLVWLVNTTLGQQCPEAVLQELERTLPYLPETSVLLLTAQNKPDGRLKSVKLLQKQAEIQEFSPIPPWKTDQLLQRVRQVAQELEVCLTPAALDLLVQAVGNETRQLYQELEKLKLYRGGQGQAVDEAAIAALVTTTTQSSLKLAEAIRMGNISGALEVASDLLGRNESALRIVSTLISQFRTWLWVRLLVDSGETDERAIAHAAEVNNPNRIYFLKQEIRALSLKQLQQALFILLELEVQLKRGADELLILHTKVIELCQVCRRSP
ncbi:DNA polymerase III subunit delta [Leptolyngbya sp. 'hensonii']|uniref:DNA polymerase III subunit delta n=1 Tax=Leptolyngbya sp. 'hensonii' TaxID=1922337 RepID=UPI00094F6A20|nr:DNA polymerase III subunit delta [Leptolyngbya sp. 'hensonii']OLP15716.1 DNA polymerase III subunit delta [Leptolyngbya sp. 'hensonii']